MKREPVGSEREQNSWLGTTLRQAQASGSDACPDAEMLAAWADGGLSPKAAAAVELHASSCSRCMAVLAAMERSAPAAAGHAWTPARVFRWLAPLTAVATAVAIWIVVPDRPIATLERAPAHDSAATEPGTRYLEPGTRNLEPGTLNLEPGTPNLEPGAPSTQNRESRAFSQPAPSARVDNPATDKELKSRVETRRESEAPEAFGATAAAPSAPPAAAPADALAETIAPTMQRSAIGAVTTPRLSFAPSNPLIRWRIVAPSSIERSSDGGKTWAKTTAPASTAVAIRAVDSERAVATTSDGANYYTLDGGVSWTRVQEKTAAPF